MVAKFQPYHKVLDSGNGWLGEIPAHWEMRRLKIDVENVSESADAIDNNGLYIALENVVKWSGHLCNLKQNPSIEGKVKRFHTGDVLFGKLRPYLAKVTQPPNNGFCVTEFLVLRPRSNQLTSDFLELYLRSKPVIDVINSSTYGAKMPRANWAFIGCIDLLIPSLSEQASIVKFLSFVNFQIQKETDSKDKLISLLIELKQAITYRAVTKGLDPTVVLKESGAEWMGMVPEHWMAEPLGRLMVQRKEKNKPIKTKEILSLSMHTGVTPYSEKPAGGNKAKDDLSDYMLAYPGDIVINSMNVVVGSVGLSKYFGAVSPVYYMLRPRHSLDPVEYFNQIFQTEVFQKSLFGLGNGIMYVESGSGKLNTIRLRIPMIRLNKVLMPHPPPEEQRLIVEYLYHTLSKIDVAIASAQREIELINEYKTRLNTDVITGKVDVRKLVINIPDIRKSVFNDELEEV